MRKIQPFVRYARLMHIIDTEVFKAADVYAYDHRLFICTQGECTVIAGGVHYEISVGDALFIRPGVPYRYSTSKEFSFLAFNFDFFYDYAYKALPIPPDSLRGFKKSEIIEPFDLPMFEDIEPVLKINGTDLIPTATVIEREYRHRRLYADGRMSALTADMLYCFFRTVSHEKLPQSKDIVHQIENYVREHYSERCDNVSIAEELSYHPIYVNRLWKAYTGITLHQYINRFRIEKAMALLQTTRLTISEIGKNVGFTDSAHFSRNFKNYTGKTPGEFRFKL